MPTRAYQYSDAVDMIGTDLTKATYESVDTTAKTATLMLPPVSVISARLNHDRDSDGSYLYEASSNGVIALLPGSDKKTNAINNALQLGQKDIATYCSSAYLADAAKKSAEDVLAPLISLYGWKVKISWQ